MRQTEGSPIRRIGHECWQRNIAVALGNAPADAAIIEALQQRRDSASVMVQEHIDWALARQQAGLGKIEKQVLRLVRAVEKGMPRDA